MKPKVIVKEIGDVTIFASTRVMDIDYVEELKEIVPTLIENGHKKFLFNFEYTDIFCSTALGVLVNLKNLSVKKGGDTRLCCVNYTLHQILSHTRLEDIFEIYNSQKEAIESFKKKPARVE